MDTIKQAPYQPRREEYQPAGKWREVPHAWAEIYRLRVGGYTAFVEDQDGDASTWNVGTDYGGIIRDDYEPGRPSVRYHSDLAMEAAERQLVALGALKTVGHWIEEPE